jgi:hypothetical protein
LKIREENTVDDFSSLSLLFFDVISTLALFSLLLLAIFATASLTYLNVIAIVLSGMTPREISWKF